MKSIRASIDTALSTTRFDASDRLTVWNKLESAHTRSLRRPMRLVILVMLLAAAFATALAFTLSKAYFEDVAALQSKSGYYDDWSLAEKLYFFDLMIEYGAVPKTEELQAILEDPMDDASREACLDAFAAQRYGINGRTDVIGLESILIKEKGELRYWSLEDMAWYTQLHESHGILGYDVCLMSVPGDDVISPEEATAIAKAAVMDAFGLTEAQIDTYRPLLEYSIHRSYADQYDPFYIVTFEGENTYYCGVDNEGNIMTQQTHPQYFGESPYETAEREVRDAEAAAKRMEEMQARQTQLEAEYGPMNTWAAEVYYQYAPDYYLLPGEEEYSYADALGIASQALQQTNPNHYTDTLLEQLITNGFLLRAVYDDDLDCWHNYYYFNFVHKPVHPFQEASFLTAFVCVDALTGEIVNLEDYTNPNETGGNG